MCLCKKVNKFYLGNDKSQGKAVKLTTTKFQKPLNPLKKTYGSVKKYVNGKVQM